MTATERRAYLFVVLCLLALLLLAGCSGQKTKDGELASLVALESAEEAAEECMDDAVSMYSDSATMYLSAIPDGMSEAVTALLLDNYMDTRQDTILGVVDRCMRPIADVARQFNLTDQQRMASQTKIAGIAVGGVVGYLIMDSIVAGAASGNGDTYTTVGPGGRLIQFTDDDQISERGWTIFGGDKSGNNPVDGGASELANGGQSPPISNSGDGDVVGNTMNITFGTGKNSSGSAVTDIPNFSPDPVTGGEVSGDNSTIRANP